MFIYVIAISKRRKKSSHSFDMSYRFRMQCTSNFNFCLSFTLGIRLWSLYIKKTHCTDICSIFGRQRARVWEKEVRWAEKAKKEKENCDENNTTKIVMITPTTHKQIEITAFPIFFTHAHHQRSCCTIYLTSPSLLVNSSIVQLISFETSMDSCSGRNSNVHLILRKSKRNQNDFFSFLHINVAGMHLEPLLITLTSDCMCMLF